MGNLNRCEVIGRLAADPETRATSGGKAVVYFRVAVNSYWKDRNTGEKKERTEYIPFEAWGSVAQHAQTLLKKGREILAVGRFKTRKYEKDGEDCYFTVIVCEQFQLLGVRPADSPATDAGEPATDSPEEFHDQETVGIDDDEEIPF